MKIGILSDIHEDGERLREVLRGDGKARGQRNRLPGRHRRFRCPPLPVPVDPRRFVLPGPVRRNCRWVVAGNHDLFAIRKLPDVNGCFPFPEDWYQLDFAERNRLGRQQVWLFEQQELPPLLTGNGPGLSPFPASLPGRGTGRGARFILACRVSRPERIPGLAPEKSLGFPVATSRLLKEQECRLGISGHLHPGGLAVAAARRFDFLPLSHLPDSPDLVQYVCPCTAGISRKNGFLVLDTAGMTLEAVAVKSGRYRIGCFPLTERRGNCASTSNVFFWTIVLPTLLTIGLFILLIFRFIIPYFEQNMLLQKKEMIRELISASVSIADTCRQQALAGKMSEAAAQAAAILQIRNIRYGTGNKDYCWITDLRPRMIQHPYRPDLNGTDLGGFRDPRASGSSWKWCAWSKTAAPATSITCGSGWTIPAASSPRSPMSAISALGLDHRHRHLHRGYPRRDRRHQETPAAGPAADLGGRWRCCSLSSSART